MSFAQTLLAHHDAHARALPWRESKDPYRIWLSEIMLQQTTVATVIPYYQNFLEAFPTVGSLATATLEDVLHLWQGLGYYSRARNLHACANKIVAEHNSCFPQTYEALLTLPGIGPYTAAAIAAIAFDEPATVVDGNVERVISRLHRIQTPLPEAKTDIKPIAASLTPTKRAGDYAEAMMDLGATLCTPKNPKCLLCPVSSFCEAYTQGDATNFPKKQPKKKRPEKSGTAWIHLNDKGEIYLEKRAPKGLLANLWQVPNTGLPAPDNALTPDSALSFNKVGEIRHVFTHFGLTLQVMLAKTPTNFPKTSAAGYFSLTNLPPLPTVMRKVLAKCDLE